MTLEIRKFLTLSTAHLTAWTATLLNNTDAMLWPCVGGPFNEYGWFIWCSTPDEAEHQQRDIPPDLRVVMDFALSMGIHHLLFDRDADEVEGLPTYGW